MERTLLLLGMVAGFAWGDVVPAVPDHITASCPPPFTSVGGKCLFFETLTKTSWEDMRAICRTIGGDLARIDTGELLGDVVNYINTNALPEDRFWIGATDKGQEGTWTWLDGTPVTMGFPLWDHCQGNEPSNQEGEDCAEIDGRNCFYLHDNFCTAELYGVCEYV